MSPDEVKSRVDELLALLRGEPGPFLETESSFFGKKRVDPSMKDKAMETDCGGMIITKARMTYGEADELARSVDLSGFLDFVRTWEAQRQAKPSCYWKPREDGKVYIGAAWWAIYSYLATYGLIAGDPNSYNNTLEYLYDEILKRLVSMGIAHTEDGRYFSFKEPE